MCRAIFSSLATEGGVIADPYRIIICIHNDFNTKKRNGNIDEHFSLDVVVLHNGIVARLLFL